MEKSFWWDYRVTDYLFKGLTAHTVGGLLGMCFCVASMAFIFEFLKYLQAKQRQKELMLRSLQLRTICPTDGANLLQTNESNVPSMSTSTSNNAIIITKLDRAMLYGADLSLWFSIQNLGYILMLSIMLFNGWLFIFAVLGGGFGYFIFGQMFMKINLQNCQILRDTFCMPKCPEPETVPTSRDGESTPALEAATSSAVLEVNVNIHAEK